MSVISDHETTLHVISTFFRVSYSDKEGRFLAEKKIPLSEVVNLVIRSGFVVLRMHLIQMKLIHI